MEQPDEALATARRRSLVAVLAGVLVVAVVELTVQPGSELLRHSTVSHAAVLASVPVVLALLVGLRRRFVDLADAQRWFFVAITVVLLVRLLDAAVLVPSGGAEIYLHEWMRVTAALVLAAFLCLGRRDARRAVVAVLGVALVGLATTSVNDQLSDEAPFNVLALVTIALLADGLASSTDVLRVREARARAVAELAFVDQLTGLGNRRAAMARLDEEEEVGALLLLDIDHFKETNDEHGHAVGDRVLQELADVLRRGVRAGAVTTRWGGEEFLVLLPPDQAGDVEAMAVRLRHAVRDAALVVPTTVSVGCAVVARGDWQAALQRADTALYAAKAAGRDRVVVG